MNKSSQGLEAYEWNTAHEMGLVNEAAIDWNGLLSTLNSNFISLEDKETDKLVWKKIVRQVIIQ